LLNDWEQQRWTALKGELARDQAFARYFSQPWGPDAAAPSTFWERFYPGGYVGAVVVYMLMATGPSSNCAPSDRSGPGTRRRAGSAPADFPAERCLTEPTADRASVGPRTVPLHLKVVTETDLVDVHNRR
jgi:hypothetical protein